MADIIGAHNIYRITFTCHHLYCTYFDRFRVSTNKFRFISILIGISFGSFLYINAYNVMCCYITAYWYNGTEKRERERISKPIKQIELLFQIKCSIERLDFSNLLRKANNKCSPNSTKEIRIKRSHLTERKTKVGQVYLVV